MFKKRGSILLALIMVFNLFTTFTPFDGSGVVFAEDDVYVYDPEGQTGDGYYFNDGTAQTGDTGLVYFNDTQKGTITVQNYDVSNIGWLSGNENLWTRNNMFDQSKARDRIQMDATLNDGYGNTPKAYDTDYVFYKTSSWNGSIEQGGMSKIARRMWGYYTPPQSGSYRFRVISDDGHYINFYLDDIFYDPKYDHYDIGTTYNEKWDRFYENGVNPVANINKDTPQSPMIVTSNVTTTLPAIQMTQGEVYPFFIEYFNWGGGGKFYFQVSLNGGPFQQVNTEHLYPEVINVPRNPNSGLDLTVENGTRTIHGYDNFNAETIDTNVWENITNFDGSNQMLLSEGGLSSIKMKGNYANYDTYKIRVDILSEGDQAEGLSIGGIGVSSGDEVWTHNLSMDQGVNNDRWYRKYGITEYGSISNSNATGNMLIAEEIVEQQDNPTDVWKNKPIRMEIDAVRLTDGTGYKVSTAFYDVNESGNTGEVIKSIVKNYLNDEFDFEEFYLTSIAPEVDWITAFDNYDFVATKYLVFDSLRVDWESNTYKLSWDLVPGATGYKVFYQTGINSSGVPIIQEFPITGTNIESIKDGYITFPDNSAYCNHPFKVIATVDGYDMSSNTVYVGGNASNLVLSGSYNDNDYTATWNDLNIVNKNLVQSYTYSLFYGDTQSTVNLPVEGAQSLSSDQLQYVFEDLQTSSKYYGKYLQLVADVVYTKGENHFYSNIIQIKSDIRIEVQHVKDQYVIGWKAENMFEKYRLFRSDDAADFASAGNIPNLTNDLILNVSSSREDNGYIYFKVADTDSTYINKAYIAGGYYANSTSPNIYSNIAATAGDVTVPTLEYLQTAFGDQRYQWAAFEGATKVELYYGTSADDINTLLSDDGSMLTNNYLESDDSTFENKYVQARYYKDGIWYYSNIVRTSSFDDIGGKIVNDADDPSQYNFEINWQDAVWPKDSLGNTYEGSYYELYYIDDSGQEVLIATNITDSEYVISDIYGANDMYLNKNVFVKAVCPVVDQFGISHTATLTSPSIKPLKIDFDSLDGILDTSNNNTFTLSWEAPEKIVDGVSETVNVVTYDILSSDAKDTLLDGAPILSLSPTEFEKYWTDVTETGANSNIYHKFFKVKIKVDGVSYYTNTAYSGEKPELSIVRFGDDFELSWPLVEQADSIRIYYGDSEDSDDFTLYSEASLSGSAIAYTLENMTSDSEFNGKYYKIAAVFDGFEIDSNAILVDVTSALPQLVGEYDKDSNAFRTTWNDVAWANGDYEYYYQETLTDENDHDTSQYTLMPDAINNAIKNATSYIFDNVASNDYREKFVRIRAVNGNYSAYSNAVYVLNPAIDWELQGLFGEDNVRLKLGTVVEITYTFEVYQDMKYPYITMALNGSPYLMFDKVSAYMTKTTDGVTEDVSIRLMSEKDTTNGVTSLRASLIGDAPKFVADGTVYTLVVSSSVEVNEKRAGDVYEALRASISGAENWELPYEVKNITVNDVVLDEDMFIQYDTYWNVDDTEPTDDTRQSSQEMFNIEVEMMNKAGLPSSL